MAATKSPESLAAIRERVLAAIASRDLPPSRNDLYHLCASFTTNCYVDKSLASLLDDGLVRDEIVSRSWRPGRDPYRVRVYHATVPSRHTRSHKS